MGVIEMLVTYFLETYAPEMQNVYMTFYKDEKSSSEV